MWDKSSNQPEDENLSKSGRETCVNCKYLIVNDRRIPVSIEKDGIRVPRSEDMSEADLGGVFTFSPSGYMHVTCYRARIEGIKYERGLNTVMVGAALATSLIFIQGLIGLSSLDWPGLISAVAFAAALPPLIAAAFTNSLQKLETDLINSIGPTIFLPNNDPDSIQFGQFFLFGLIIEGIAIGAAFWHISWIAGIVLFISTVVICVSVLRRKKQ